MRGTRPLPGDRVADLQSPLLLVDLVALEHNLGVAAKQYESSSCKIRPHAKNHRSPALAELQMRAGATVGGVCAAKVAEAEVMVHGGVRSVLVTNQITTAPKIARLAMLCREAEVIVACDDTRNAEELSLGASKVGVELGVVIEVDTGLERAGVKSVAAGVELARAITQLPSLRFRGLMSHEVVRGAPGADVRRAAAREALGRCIAMRVAIEREGIPVEIVSSGETWSWDVASDLPGITEVQLGSYLLMDAGYSYLTDFRIAAFVRGHITCVRASGVAIGNVGARALGLNRGLPVVIQPSEVTVHEIEPDRVALRFAPGSEPKVGDAFRIVPGNQDTMVNRWDYFVAVRDDRVEAVWDIAARGASN
jgi:3-hydroxy-D-aspartate aldolase